MSTSVRLPPPRVADPAAPETLPVGAPTVEVGRPVRRFGDAIVP